MSFGAEGPFGTVDSLYRCTILLKCLSQEVLIGINWDAELFSLEAMKLLFFFCAGAFATQQGSFSRLAPKTQRKMARSLCRAAAGFPSPEAVQVRILSVATNHLMDK